MMSAGLARWVSKLIGAERSELPTPLPSTAVLVDVRSEGEFSGGHIDGAVSLPLDRIQTDVQRAIPDRTTLVVLYCRSGARSGHACQLLAQMGYEQVHNGGAIDRLAFALGRRFKSPARN